MYYTGWQLKVVMMPTLLHAFRITGPLWGETTGHRDAHWRYCNGGIWDMVGNLYPTLFCGM